MSDIDSENAVGVDVDTVGSDARDDLRAEMARSLARGGMAGVQVISWETANEVLTPKRKEIIETLREREVGSVRDLARVLERDKGQVSRDLGKLAEHGVIRYEKQGNAKAPYLTQKHVVVEPIV